MRLRWILLLFGSIITVSIVLVFSLSMNPKSVALINLSIFKNSAAVSDAVLKRLDPHLLQTPLIALHLDAKNLFHEEVAQTLQKARPKQVQLVPLSEGKLLEGRLNILLTDFPRGQSEESAFAWCPQKDYHQWQCVLLPKVRSLYRKRLPQGRWIGFMDQVGANRFVLAMTLEKSKEP